MLQRWLQETDKGDLALMNFETVEWYLRDRQLCY